MQTTRRDFLTAIAAAFLPWRFKRTHEPVPTRIFNGFVGTLYDVRFVSFTEILKDADPRGYRLVRKVCDDFVRKARLADPKHRARWTIWTHLDLARGGWLYGLGWEYVPKRWI